ncbi:unnamed protein product [Lepeophtheirus salmonis]|uniref:(salmon louse) hypothetical protein n=1 Tax=Lepeophtheirus salmonis TaxID=72036 RepID=A0A7R8H6D4_LEPSM|nr:unnamed protein product [Lepeophtheirus salmonis]CAF2894833.1 unnamed protein product [Lepeophtheirus salmonis]
MAKGGSDWFSYKEKYYMVRSDYLCGFFEIDLISTGDSKTVIGKFKITNGSAEAGVKQVKLLPSKTSHGKYDPYLGLLNLHNTSAAGLNYGKNLRLKRRQLLLKPYGMDEIHINKTTIPNRVEGLSSLSVQSHNVGVPSETDARNQGPISQEYYIPTELVVVVVEVEDLYGVSSVSITRAYEARIQSTGKYSENTNALGCSEKVWTIVRILSNKVNTLEINGDDLFKEFGDVFDEGIMLK